MKTKKTKKTKTEKVIVGGGKTLTIQLGSDYTVNPDKPKPGIKK